MKRYVTGVNADGRSYVVSSEELSTSDFQTLWSYEPGQVPEWISAIDPELAAEWIGPDVSGGLRWLFVPLIPDAEAAKLGEHPKLQGIDENGFHTTRTVDFDYVMEGEIVMYLDEGPVKLQKGDCVIQQGTRHAWHNESDKLAILVALVHRPNGT
jgi:mannose-6-phosphate isomerase-like protein (cupin superfamily)